MKFLVAVLLIALLFASCKKEEENEMTIFTGKVKDARSGENIAGVQIDFLLQGVVNGSFNNNYIPTTNDVSDANGNYRLVFEEGVPSGFRFEMNRDGFYFSRQDFNPDNFANNSENSLDLFIDSRAWVNLRIINEEVANNGDQISLSLTTENNACEDCCGNQSFNFTGQTNESIICEAFGNSEASVMGVAIDFITGQQDVVNSVILQPQDTTELLIVY